MDTNSDSPHQNSPFTSKLKRFRERVRFVEDLKVFVPSRPSQSEHKEKEGQANKPEIDSPMISFDKFTSIKENSQDEAQPKSHQGAPRLQSCYKYEKLTTIPESAIPTLNAEEISINTELPLSFGVFSAGVDSGDANDDENPDNFSLKNRKYSQITDEKVLTKKTSKFNKVESQSKSLKGIQMFNEGNQQISVLQDVNERLAEQRAETPQHYEQTPIKFSEESLPDFVELKLKRIESSVPYEENEPEFEHFLNPNEIERNQIIMKHNLNDSFSDQKSTTPQMPLSKAKKISAIRLADQPGNLVRSRLDEEEKKKAAVIPKFDDFEEPFNFLPIKLETSTFEFKDSQLQISQNKYLGVPVPESKNTSENTKSGSTSELTSSKQFRDPHVQKPTRKNNLEGISDKMKSYLLKEVQEEQKYLGEKLKTVDTRIRLLKKALKANGSRTQAIPQLNSLEKIPNESKNQKNFCENPDFLIKQGKSHFLLAPPANLHKKCSSVIHADYREKSMTSLEERIDQDFKQNSGQKDSTPPYSEEEEELDFSRLNEWIEKMTILEGNNSIVAKESSPSSPLKANNSRGANRFSIAETVNNQTSLSNSNIIFTNSPSNNNQRKPRLPFDQTQRSLLLAKSTGRKRSKASRLPAPAKNEDTNKITKKIARVLSFQPSGKPLRESQTGIAISAPFDNLFYICDTSPPMNTRKFNIRSVTVEQDRSSLTSKAGPRANEKGVSIKRRENGPDFLIHSQNNHKGGVNRVTLTSNVTFRVK